MHRTLRMRSGSSCTCSGWRTRVEGTQRRTVVTGGIWASRMPKWCSGSATSTQLAGCSSGGRGSSNQPTQHCSAMTNAGEESRTTNQLALLDQVAGTSANMLRRIDGANFPAVGKPNSRAAVRGLRGALSVFAIPGFYLDGRDALRCAEIHGGSPTYCLPRRGIASSSEWTHQ